MTPAASKSASDLLWSNWQAGTVIEALPTNVRPQSAPTAMPSRPNWNTAQASRSSGWKIAATSKAGQQHINVDGPLAGRILAERVYADGARLPFGGNRMRVAEAEFAFRMARDLAAAFDALLARRGARRGRVRCTRRSRSRIRAMPISPRSAPPS